jgi:hypothetical protein
VLFLNFCVLKKDKTEKKNFIFYYFRSPSPEPIYDQQGKRQNTREVRARRKIEEQRHQLVSELLVLNPDYKAPADYKYVLKKKKISSPDPLGKL